MVLNGLVVFGRIPTVREWTLDLSEPVQIELSHYFIYIYEWILTISPTLIRGASDSAYAAAAPALPVKSALGRDPVQLLSADSGRDLCAQSGWLRT